MNRRRKARDRGAASYDLACLAVYVPGADGTGTRCIGFLFLREKMGVEAFDASDTSLGLFPDQKSAADAICAAAPALDEVHRG